MAQNRYNTNQQYEYYNVQPSIIHPMDYKNVAELSHYDSLDQQKVKFQFKNNIQYESQMSPDYDLFEIQKKRKKQKYKRSTNNSHKKFISALRRLFFAVISSKEKQEFQTKYTEYKSCRTYFFIILAYIKFRFSRKLLNSVRVSFINEMKIKINEYQDEISRTKNLNLKNFRQQQIIDIKYSIKSCNQYFQGNTRSAIQCMYKKDKSTVVKRQHYQSALRSVHMVEKELNQNPRTPLQQPYIEDFSHSSDRQRAQKKVIKREIRESQLQRFALEKSNHLDAGNYMNSSVDNFVNPTRDIKIKNVTENPSNDNEIFSSEKQIMAQKQHLYPPMLEAIPYIPYDPFLPPFRYKRQTKYRVDIREDFFGPMNFGFPKFYQRRIKPPKMTSYQLFPESFAQRN